MRQISRVLGVSRSNLSEQVKDKSQKLPATFSNTSDGEHLRQIKTVVDKRPTYGYRRVTAHVNLALKTLGNKPVNHKRIYRIMKANKLLLQRFTARPNRTHDGKVITLHSNTRWCSDSFSIQCYNGDRVHVVFSLDTCDREIISYLSSTIGIDGSMVRDLMLESVEKRFNASDRLSSPVQWLSDNGPCYIAHETVNFGRQLGFEICTTPSYSPEWRCCTGQEP